MIPRANPLLGDSKNLLRCVAGLLALMLCASAGAAAADNFTSHETVTGKTAAPNSHGGPHAAAKDVRSGRTNTIPTQRRHSREGGNLPLKGSASSPLSPCGRGSGGEGCRFFHANKTASSKTATGKTTSKPKKALAAPVRDPRVYRWITIEGFGEIALYKPTGQSRGLALFASGDGGWVLGVTYMAHQAAELGFWVAGFSTPSYLKALDASASSCSNADGALVQLGADLVRELRLPADTRPVIIGYSSGATIAYTALAADAGQHLGGGISLGFCPDLLIHKAFCPGKGGLTQHWQKQPPTWVFDKRETVAARWRILQGEIDQICDPKFAPEFAAGQKDSVAVMLPNVGHGFGVPKNWVPQYIRSVKELLGERID